jgi:hypothetical protein
VQIGSADLLPALPILTDRPVHFQAIRLRNNEQR